jgi:hypothetical protein
MRFEKIVWVMGNNNNKAYSFSWVNQDLFLQALATGMGTGIKKIIKIFEKD